MKKIATLFVLAGLNAAAFAQGTPVVTAPQANAQYQSAASTDNHAVSRAEVYQDLVQAKQNGSIPQHPGR